MLTVIINKPLEAAQLYLGTYPHMDKLFENIAPNDELTFIACEYELHIPKGDDTTTVNGHQYSITIEGSCKILINSKIAGKTIVTYPIFVNNDYYTGYVFEDGTEADELACLLTELVKAAGNYLMMRELHDMRVMKKFNV